MQNLNDPKLTNQQRQHILRLSIDKEYRQKYEKAKEHTDYIFQSYWVVQSQDLQQMDLFYKSLIHRLDQQTLKFKHTLDQGL